MDVFNNGNSKVAKALLVLLIILSVYFAVKAVAEVKSYRFIGGGTPSSNIISFDGKGEVFAAPDLATISLTIRETASTVKDAQAEVTKKETAVLDFLDKAGIEKKDIKTESYTSYPKYNSVTPCYSYGMPCKQNSPKIVGYETSEYISVKVRDLTKAGDILNGIGLAGVSEISGPDFSIENETNLREKARKMAIDEAKAKAESLAKDLGVHLIRIVGFSDDSNHPYYYAKAEMMNQDASGTLAPAPALPAGENKITSNVSISYEIR